MDKIDERIEEIVEDWNSRWRCDNRNFSVDRDIDFILEMVKKYKKQIKQLKKEIKRLRQNG